MTMQAAINFIKRARIDDELRTELNLAENNTIREEILVKHNLSFNYAEFEDAYNSMLAACQYEDAAMDLKEFKLWWDYLLST